MIRLLYEEPFMQMFQTFQTWRIDPFIRGMEARRQKGKILPFVRGLRLSALLIYAIREMLEGTSLTANWGHLVDESGNFCSCECDVIIHHEGGHIRRWDGTKNPIMDFRFIAQGNTVAVISCKSYLRSGDIDTEYCNLMEPFVKKIWLFAECCGPRSTETIRAKAVKYGYERFWYLYTWSKQTEPRPNKGGWYEFVQEVKKLKQ
jgi:hypothetical protein